MNSIEQCRRFFAEFVVRSAGSSDERLLSAFSSVARESFVGPGPWPVSVGSGYILTVDANPRWLYQDILIGLKQDRVINNGQPTLHAYCLVAADLKPGETVIHVGAGTGYYTAILATLVDHGGSVLAFEIEPELADHAISNLANFTNVTVRAESGAEAKLPPSDVIYVSAGVSDIPSSWLDALNIGGRLILPLTAEAGFGVMLKVVRMANDQYSADAIIRAGFMPCTGARHEPSAQSLAQALETESLHKVRSLRRKTLPDATAWCIGNGWWLSTEPVAGPADGGRSC